MMAVLPPKWTELFQHQQEQEIVEQESHDQTAQTHLGCPWHNPTHYNTYQACSLATNQDHHQHLPSSPRKLRTLSYSSNSYTTEPMKLVENENETYVRGTRFRLTKATIRIDDEDEEQQQHQQLNTEHEYV